MPKANLTQGFFDAACNIESDPSSLIEIGKLNPPLVIGSNVFCQVKAIC